MRKRHFAITLLLCVTLSQASAQSHLQFRHINTKGYAVRNLCRSPDGILWLSTSSGLLSLPQLMSRDPNAYTRRHKQLGAVIDYIGCDSLGQVWMMTQNGDVAMYAPQQGIFVTDVSYSLAEKGIREKSGFYVVFDENRCGWVWKEGRLYSMSSKSNAPLLDAGNENIIEMQVAREEVVVITTRNLYYLSGRSGQMQRRIPLPAEIQCVPHLCVTSRGDVWMRSDIRTLWKYDYQTGAWNYHTTMPSEITGIQADADGHIWVSTMSDGIFLCREDGSVLRHLLHDPWDVNSLQSNKIYSIWYEQRNATLWIAYWKGGLSVCNTHPQDMLYLNTADVLTLEKSADGKQVYAGTEDNGIFRLGNDGVWQNIISRASVTALYADPQGTLWAGLYAKGLLRRDADGKVTLMLDGRSPYAIAEDTQSPVGNRVLYVALHGQGVWSLDAASGKAIDTGIGAKYVLDLKFHDHRLYAASTEGFFVKDGNRKWEKVCDGCFRSFCIDGQGYFWLLGNDGDEGLTLLNPERQAVKAPYELEHAALKGIVPEGENGVWIVSAKELQLLRHSQNGQDKCQMDRFLFDINPSWGSQLYYNYHAVMTDGEGYLWAGTTAGCQRMSIRRLLTQTDERDSPAPLYIGAISINDQICSPGMSADGRSFFHEDVTYTRSLNLRHNENNIVIECTQSCNDNFTSYIYSYRLKGLSDDWHPIEDNTIVLSNLPPGDYQLLVRTQNSGEASFLAIHIAPPFWLSWWAYVLYCLMAVLLTYGIVRYFINKRFFQFKLHELELQQEQQEQMNEMKLRFFTNISHDLRTPLSLIIGPVEELKKEKIEELKSWEDLQSFNSSILQPSLEMIHRNANHLLSLVGQILDFRRLEFGREKLQLGYGDIVALIRDICASFRLKSEKEQIRFSFQPSAERIDTLFDRDKTTKIMMNLLSNAFKYTGHGGSVTVKLCVSDKDVVVSVADTGMGIPDADKEYIFERFFQSDTIGQMNIGSGIGLHIVREYVRLQGGEITVSNHPEGQGSVFRFTIPLQKQKQQIEGETPQHVMQETKDSATDMPEEVSRVSGKTALLLIDDNTDFLTYMVQALSNDYEVTTANNGTEGLRLLKKHDVDIIVSDVMMPEMDGMELCRRVKTNIATSHIPVVLLTAKAMSHDELAGLEAGADDYITKPFSMDILSRRIRNLVERSLGHHERFRKEVDVSPSDITVTSIDEEFISRAIALVEEHIADSDFGVEQLSEALGLHRTQVYKKLLHLTGKTPVLFIRLLRLKRGRQLLEQSGMYVSEVAYRVGFSSPRLFSKYFKEEFGVLPKDIAH